MKCRAPEWLQFTTSESIKLQAAVDDNSLTIIISDTGIGIAAEAMSRIFGEFQQAESTTRQQFGGTGLGLAISCSLARLWGGNITAVSALGEGSTFTLTLPVQYSQRLEIRDWSISNLSNYHIWM
ncbi:MAG: hypothetical protein GY796_18520 [Chloroflexi bacterium]|nr:hypothetical protein [Chloroflexota bacterium]